MTSTKIAIVQYKPVFNQLNENILIAQALIKQAADESAQLVVFGETWFSGYPAWIDHIPGMGLWDHQPTKNVFQQMHENSLAIPSPAFDQLCQFAKTSGLYLVFGANEKVVEGHSHGTIYNSLITISPEGKLINHHRKLMPTYTEKLVYGLGDGHGLRAVETKFGKLGGLICWEHWMPLARQTMHNEGEVIHVAVWPAVHDIHQIASRHYAFEGRCFVIAVGQIMQAKDLMPFFQLPESLANNPDQFLLNGGSCVIGPDGKYLLSPQLEHEDLFIVEIPDVSATIREKLTLDVTGHYQRPDVFDLSVNKIRRHR